MHEPGPRADISDIPDPFESGGPGGEFPAHEVGAGARCRRRGAVVRTLAARLRGSPGPSPA